ncbi:MAG TPA: hypothetical protein DCL61_08645 [Cyanobacteria bacterium UBA12227]|nr:hypothetical protein [Cyanobacteria bacterium UBA12227]HAX88189.1 hypothetical protein [Cyanobacteria bacterium UBA11370]
MILKAIVYFVEIWKDNLQDFRTYAQTPHEREGVYRCAPYCSYPGFLFKSLFNELNKQKGKLLSLDTRLPSDFSNSRIHFSNFSKQKGKLLSHFSNSRIHFSNFSKQNSKLLSHFSNSRIYDDYCSREKLF